ncbi:MAG: HvfX family Cu-binding RiPP maturation protein [Woeseiaceae bacterium]
MDTLIAGWHRLTAALESVGEWVGLLPLRLLLAWEFWESGIVKLQGENWFGDVQDAFPFPFNGVPADISWFLATWTEILGALGLALGLFTRFWAIGLIILSIVAIAGVHWPDDWGGLAELWQGYAITDKGYGNYKLPLIFMVMLWPLVFLGPGKASLDRLLARWLVKP